MDNASSNITVVIPTYNERDNLPALVNLLAELKIAGLTVLVVDDNSPDGTGGAYSSTPLVTRSTSPRRRTGSESVSHAA